MDMKRHTEAVPQPETTATETPPGTVPTAENTTPETIADASPAVASEPASVQKITKDRQAGTEKTPIGITGVEVEIGRFNKLVTAPFFGVATVALGSVAVAAFKTGDMLQTGFLSGGFAGVSATIAAIAIRGGNKRSAVGTRNVVVMSKSADKNHQKEVKGK
jgi:hypothetical protein